MNTASVSQHLLTLSQHQPRSHIQKNQPFFLIFVNLKEKLRCICVTYLYRKQAPGAQTAQSHLSSLHPWLSYYCLSVCVNRVVSLSRSLLVVFFCFFFWLPRSESPSPHSDLIRGSGWTLYLPMDWVAACVNLRASCTTFNTHGEPLWLTVVCSAVTQIMSQVTGQGAECALFSIFLEKMFTIYLKSEKLRHTM